MEIKLPYFVRTARSCELSITTPMKRPLFSVNVSKYWKTLDRSDFYSKSLDSMLRVSSA